MMGQCRMTHLKVERLTKNSIERDTEHLQERDEPLQFRIVGSESFGNKTEGKKCHVHTYKFKRLKEKKANKNSSV